MLLQTLNPKLNNPKVKPLIMTVSWVQSKAVAADSEAAIV